ncbi:MAG: hypothetical protein JXX28_04430 [Deltaproteobacteria bacterium]|nr:hypothetical protein [Deltaproteobacteria bacterium]
MLKRAAAGGVFLAMVLACGGGGPDEAGVGDRPDGVAAKGSPVGPYATSMAQHFASQNPALPCPTYAVGEAFSILDFSGRIDKVELLPTDAGGHALGITASWRNDTPMKSTEMLDWEVYGSDGEKGKWIISSESNRFREARGIVPGDNSYPPNKWVQSGSMARVDASAADGAVIYVFYSVEEFDPTDPKGRRKIKVLKGHAVVDVGVPAQ